MRIIYLICVLLLVACGSSDPVAPGAEKQEPKHDELQNALMGEGLKVMGDAKALEGTLEEASKRSLEEADKQANP
jgi:hypothetical protein